MKLPNLNKRVTLYFPQEIETPEGNRRDYFEATIPAEFYPLGGTLDPQAPGYAPGEQARASIRWPCVTLPPDTGRTPERLKTEDGRVWQVVSFQDSAPPYVGYKSLLLARAGEAAELPH